MDFLMQFVVSQYFGHLEGIENPHPPTHLLPLLKRISQLVHGRKIKLQIIIIIIIISKENLNEKSEIISLLKF
jgi:hypothetical protein